MESNNYTDGTIRLYLLAIQDFAEPDDSGDPLVLCSSIKDTLISKQPELSESCFANLRAALNALFQMQTGMSVKQYRKTLVRPDQYAPLLSNFSSYCNEFLHLTDVVTRASLREVHKFLLVTVGANDIRNVCWSDITAKTIANYVLNQLGHLKTSSVGISVTAIRRFFNYLEHSDVSVHKSVLTMPLAVPNWSKNGYLPVTLSDEEFQRLDAYQFNSGANVLRNRAVLLCFLDLGLRCNEVANLQFQDIHWGDGTIIIRKTKTHAERVLPLSQRLGTALEQYVLNGRLILQGDALFFKSIHKMMVPANTESIRSIIRYAFKKEGISGWHVGTHALRRSVGSKLYSSGNDLKTVADVLGHTSVSATKAYVKVDVAALRSLASSWPRRESV